MLIMDSLSALTLTSPSEPVTQRLFAIPQYLGFIPLERPTQTTHLGDTQGQRN